LYRRSTTSEEFWHRNIRCGAEKCSPTARCWHSRLTRRPPALANTQRSSHCPVTTSSRSFAAFQTSTRRSASTPCSSTTTPSSIIRLSIFESNWQLDWARWLFVYLFANFLTLNDDFCICFFFCSTIIVIWSVYRQSRPRSCILLQFKRNTSYSTGILSVEGKLTLPSKSTTQCVACDAMMLSSKTNSTMLSHALSGNMQFYSRRISQSSVLTTDIINSVNRFACIVTLSCSWCCFIVLHVLRFCWLKETLTVTLPVLSMITAQTSHRRSRSFWRSQSL